MRSPIPDRTHLAFCADELIDMSLNIDFLSFPTVFRERKPRSSSRTAVWAHTGPTVRLSNRQTVGLMGRPNACTSFAIALPLSWIGKMKQRVAENSPKGYYNHLLQLAESLLGVVAR